MEKIVLEVCANNLDSAMAAAAAGAERIELCQALQLGGITPSKGVIEASAAIPGLKTNVLIRAREGSFHYMPEEIAAMVSDIEFCRRAGVNAVVIGALTPEGDVDTDACRRMTDAAGDMPVTFHRAFDRARDPFKALEDIIALGCSRLLTSGQKPSALDGAAMLGRLNRAAAGRLVVMPGGGVTAGNAGEILRLTGCREIHASAKKTGTDGSISSDPKEIRELLDAIGRL